MEQEEQVQISNESAEQAVIYSAIHDSGSIEKLRSWLPNQDRFYYAGNQRIWETILDMHSNREFIDMVTVSEKLREKFPNSPELITEVAFLPELPSTANCEEYAKIVLKRYTKNRISLNARKISTLAINSDSSVSELLEKMSSDIREFQDLQPQRRKELEIEVNDTVNNIKFGDNIIPFGIPALDDPAGGMTRKEVTVIGGRPGNGKTTLSLNIAISLAEHNRVGVIFNREMSNTEMLKKMITIESGISYGRIRRRELNESELDIIDKTGKHIVEKYKTKLLMFDGIRDIATSMRELSRIGKIDYIIDDYIQLIKPYNSDVDRRFQIEEIMNEYKWVAKEKDAAVILISQLNRDVEKRFTDPRPRLSDFAEGGTIEQVAENAIFCFYGYSFDSEVFAKHQYELIFAKTRYGESGTYKVGFNGDRCRIYPTEEEARLSSLQ